MSPKFSSKFDYYTDPLADFADWHYIPEEFKEGVLPELHYMPDYEPPMKRKFKMKSSKDHPPSPSKTIDEFEEQMNKQWIQEERKAMEFQRQLTLKQEFPTVRKRTIQLPQPKTTSNRRKTNHKESEPVREELTTKGRRVVYYEPPKPPMMTAEQKRERFDQVLKKNTCVATYRVRTCENRPARFLFPVKTISRPVPTDRKPLMGDGNVYSQNVIYRDN